MSSNPAQTGPGITEEAPSPLPENTLLDGRYQLVRVIGSGGLAHVYEACDHRVPCGQRVAVKVLHPTLSDDADIVARFETEGQCASRVSHPNVVKVSRCAHSVEGPYYLVLEYLFGTDLGTILEERGEQLLPIECVVNIAREACAALTAVHGIGLVHRDVKPDNLFLLEEGARQQVGLKLIDFGCVWSPDGPQCHLNPYGITFGTPEYMAPEQARGSSPDPRSDLFSLGVTLYELLTGQVPFPGGAMNQLRYPWILDKPTPIREFRNVPAWLEAIVFWTLACHPEDRPQSATALQYHLERVLQPNYF